jgi:hypothetical protein
VVLGSFVPGQSFTFPNGGVSEFSVSGISPLVDPSNPSAFPLELGFNTATASFTQQAIPEPSVLSLVMSGMGVLALMAFWKRKRS